MTVCEYGEVEIAVDGKRKGDDAAGDVGCNSCSFSSSQSPPLSPTTGCSTGGGIISIYLS